MSDLPPPNVPPPNVPNPDLPTPNVPTGDRRPQAAPVVSQLRRSRLSVVWLIPAVALLIAAWLGFRTVREQGPVVTLQFNGADGLTAGQTRVRHKAVELGQVEAIRLTDDMAHVLVRVRMTREATPYLTDQARFWVVRPRISSGSLAGIETLVSGSYIEMDPGGRDGAGKTEFVGLEQPPGVRSGEPGRTFLLKADRLGSLGPGAPVFYRDITVGEVLGYDLGDGMGPVSITVFIRAPFDGFVRAGSLFWNASGLSIQAGPTGVRVELASLQAVLSGGVAFNSSREHSEPVQAGAEFPFYQSFSDAVAAGYTSRLTFVTYFTNPVRGLTQGSAVEFLGLQVGTVQNVRLIIDDVSGTAKVRVSFEIQPERIVSVDQSRDDPLLVAQRMVRNGLRVQSKTASYLTGSQVLAVDFVAGAAPAELVVDGNDWVLPSIGGGIDNILSAVSDISAKLDRLPIEQIASNLNLTLRSASGAMGSIQELVRKTDAGLTPALKRLPEIAQALQDASVRAGRTFASIEGSYGQNSQFNRELERAMTQVGDTARSIRILADYLDRHPEALVRGRGGVSDAR